MSADDVVLILYICLSAAVVLLPVRWSIVAYLLLSTVDFGQHSDHIGLLNTTKAVILPLYLLWRLRRYSGHQRMTLAPIAWILLTIYSAVAAFWTYYPSFAFKLTGHMLALLVICCVFMRASKGPELQASIVLPTAVGIIVIAALRSIFAPQYGEEAGRFTTFSSAQSFASLLVALYCIVLCARTVHAVIRISLCIVLVVALIFDGSRIWALGLMTSTLLALLISDVRTWVKIFAVGFVIIATTLTISSFNSIVDLLTQHSQSNRIAAALTAAYENDMVSTGLGTFRFRRGLTEKVVDQLGKSSVTELLAGHGTSSGGTIMGSQTKRLDPNRFFHNEWLRVTYEWGVIGLILFLLFIGSITTFAFQGFRKDPGARAKPLLVYMPAFLLGLTGENIIAGAGNAVSVGFLLLIGLASIAHRQIYADVSAYDTSPLRNSELQLGRERIGQDNWAADHKVPVV